MLLIAAVPVHVVAKRLGHADPSVTLRVYAHVSPQACSGSRRYLCRCRLRGTPLLDENDGEGLPGRAMVRAPLGVPGQFTGAAPRLDCGRSVSVIAC